METWEWIVLAATAGALVLLAVALVRIRRRRSRLQDRFGPEYGRTVADRGTGEAERRLDAIATEHDELEIRPLPPAARERYLEELRLAEARFVSDPKEAANAAGSLVARALEERGYPLDDDPERLATHFSMDHPDVATRFRHGRAMLVEGNGDRSTEDLRKAMIDFRLVLEDVVQETGTRSAA